MVSGGQGGGRGIGEGQLGKRRCKTSKDWWVGRGWGRQEALGRVALILPCHQLQPHLYMTVQHSPDASALAVP